MPSAVTSITNRSVLQKVLLHIKPNNFMNITYTIKCLTENMEIS